MDSLVNKYIPNKDDYENNLFVEEYYSSTDTKIYMNDVEQSEVQYINYAVQEQLKPIYGYASRTWDEVAIGNRIVTGSFRMTIKNPNRNSTIEEIKHAASDSTTQDNLNYNEREVIELQKKEWAATGSQNNTQVDQLEVIDYKNKLAAITGDDPFNNANNLLWYQIQNNLGTTGVLNTETKNKIDEDYSSLNKEKITLHPATRLYSGPEDSYPVVTLIITEDKATVLSSSNGWKYIKTSKGIVGFVKEEL